MHFKIWLQLARVWRAQTKMNHWFKVRPCFYRTILTVIFNHQIYWYILFVYKITFGSNLTVIFMVKILPIYVHSYGQGVLSICFELTLKWVTYESAQIKLFSRLLAYGEIHFNQEGKNFKPWKAKGFFYRYCWPYMVSIQNFLRENITCKGSLLSTVSL